MIWIEPNIDLHQLIVVFDQVHSKFQISIVTRKFTSSNDANNLVVSDQK